MSFELRRRTSILGVSVREALRVLLLENSFMTFRTAGSTSLSSPLSTIAGPMSGFFRRGRLLGNWVVSSCFRLPSEAVVPAEAGLACFFGMLVDRLMLPLRMRLTVARSSGGGRGSAEGLEDSAVMVEAPTTMTEATASLAARDFLLNFAMIAGRALWQE